jgi:hypothetical protein
MTIPIIGYGTQQHYAQHIGKRCTVWPASSTHNCNHYPCDCEMHLGGGVLYVDMFAHKQSASPTEIGIDSQRLLLIIKGNPTSS